MSAEVVLCASSDPGLSIDLVRFARSLSSGDDASRVHAVVLPGMPDDLADRLVAAGAHAVDRIAGSATVDASASAARIAALVPVLSPTLLLLDSSKRGREVAGRLAGTLDLPAVTGATAVHLAEDGVRVDRESLSGNAVSVERIARRPAIVALMPGTPAPEAPVVPNAERRDHAIPDPKPRTERTEVRPKAGGGVEIEKAERIVTIGRGLKKKEDLAIVEAFARSVGAQVGCTRPLAAEAGWLSDDHWIGLTGHRVRPKLYVAVGVSGAVQHLVGMRSSKVVVAINKDPNAPIFGQADYRITGDLYQIVPALTKAFGG